VIDLHCHVLAGVDDGPPDLDAALEVARAHVAAGVQTVCATSHVSGRYPNTAAELAAATRALRAALAGAGIALEVVPGAELATEMLGELSDDDLRALSLGGGPNLLIESPLRSSAGDVDHLVEQLLARGHGVVLAHPERSPGFQRDPARLTRLVAAGARCSLTASALTGRFGEHVRRFSGRMLEDGLVHNLASDSHDLEGRRPGIAEHLQAAAGDLPGADGLAGWLADEAPRALLAGERLPPPPLRVRRAPQRTGWRARLRRRSP
jgi:protein-tyrosine phosphatase